ncbi:hypothetical protein ACCO45_013320 [Purpureocillium lilacinum]|uniref:Uncharacterized protein n=1 Tax=Purpureocillium lilacinum TaxID=33203 RepID=A0ACC4DAK9_PURLI
MPRASGSGKRQQGGAGPRESKHDNGLVGPGKRIAPKKSHGHLDGPARSPDNGALAGPSSPPPHANGLNGIGKHDGAASALAAASAATLDARRGSLGTSSESSSSELSGAPAVANGVDGARQIDVNALKNADVHRDSGPLDLASTVVRSLPVQDTLAILIILMHLPYVSLTIVYGLFATLTFVPPVMSKAGWNMNLGDIMDGISQMPSLATTMAMDFFFFLVWVFLWPPIQDFMLEFAKPVVAVTLGGGASAKDGSSRGVTACFIWMFLHKLVRASRVYWPQLARHVPDGWRMPAALRDSFLRPSAWQDKRDGHGWLQSILAIHILTQGIVRYVREWYLRRERFNSTDPEAGKPGSAVTGLSATSSAAVAKRRRKQSAQVRLQQPLWAALASTKIVAMKEYEISSLKGVANKSDIHNSGSTPSFDGQPKQIWISYIGSDEVCFNTSHFPEPEAYAKVNGHSTTPAGVDTSKPFYVRINNAFWQPTRIYTIDDEKETHWTGDIYGLRPAAKYVVEFVDTKTDQVIFTTSIRTVKETLREDAPLVAGPASSQQALRPDSPATTLRTSIAAAEARLADEKNRLKTWRKDWKNRVNSLKRDNEAADNQLATAGNNDEKYKQKIRQQETQKAQAERDTERRATELDNFDTAPELTERKKKTERTFSAEKKVFDGAQKEFKCHKSLLEGEVKAKEVEKSNLNTRRNKIATRIAKIENELANLTDANNRGLDEAERRRQERVRFAEHTVAMENNYLERTNQAMATNASRREQPRALQAQVQAFQTYVNPVNGMPIEAPPMMADAHQPSSMLSDVSGFTEASDEAVEPARPAGRIGAHGSNSSGSVGEPSSPA